MDEIFSDIEQWAREVPGTRRVFLIDGDALVMPDDQLCSVQDKLRQSFPDLSRVAGYANGYNITKRTDADLRLLAGHGLKLIYIGLESGSQEILSDCKKAATVQEMITAVQRTAAAGIKSSVIVLLGLGGKGFYREHVRGTITALNAMQPRYLSFLTLMLIPGTELFRRMGQGKFEPLSKPELLRQARDIIKGLELTKTVFRSDHASNYLPLEGRFPQDKTKLLDLLDRAVQGKSRLRPEIFRGL
jgi:Fe-S oxidoreductase